LINFEAILKDGERRLSQEEEAHLIKLLDLLDTPLHAPVLDTQGYRLIRMPHPPVEVRYCLYNLSATPLGAGVDATVIKSPVYFTRDGNQVTLHRKPTALKCFRVQTELDDSEDVEEDPSSRFHFDEEQEDTNHTVYEEVSFDDEDDNLFDENRSIHDEEEDLDHSSSSYLSDLEAQVDREARITRERYQGTSSPVSVPSEKTIIFGMPLHEGHDLSQGCGDTRHKRFNRNYLAVVLCAELLRLHHRKIRHADIKPENIIFNNDPNRKKLKIRYIDFTGSRHDDIPNTYQSVSDNYIAPELDENTSSKKMPTYEGDVYSLGCVINQTCRGARDTFILTEDRAIPNLENFPAEFGEVIPNVISHMTQVNPDERWSLNKVISTLLCPEKPNSIPTVAEIKETLKKDRLPKILQQLAHWMEKTDDSKPVRDIQNRIIKLLTYDPEVWFTKGAKPRTLLKELMRALAEQEKLHNEEERPFTVSPLPNASE